MGKPTPGPWEVEPYNPYDKEIAILGGLVVVDYDDVNHKEQEANARLIAASPCLLATSNGLCKAVSDHMNKPTPETLAALVRCHDESLKAIAKAEGPQ